MVSFTRILALMGLAAGWAAPAYCQPQLGNIYHADNQNGTVFIYVENHSFVPCTITLYANLKNVKSETVLPGRFVVYPSKMPRLLTTLTYQPGELYSFNYWQTNQFGIYNGHAPDSSYVYPLPYQLSERVAQNSFDGRKQRMLHHHYFFNLPKDTPVRAVREGIIATFKQDLPAKKGTDTNFITVFHDDGTYAEYANFNQNSVAVQLGQRVAKGEVLCYAGGLKRSWFRLRVLYPGAAHAREVSVVLENGN